MQSDKLGDLLVDRIRQHKLLDWDITAEFVDVTTGTIQRWISKAGGPPRGERLNRLWHFLSAVGVASPELDRLSPYHRYVSEMHAYGVIKLKNGAESERHDVDFLELLGLKNEQDALRVIRGDQTPVNPQIGTVEDLKDLYDSQLAEAKQKWSERFAQALPGTRSPATVSSKAEDESNTAAPQVPPLSVDSLTLTHPATTLTPSPAAGIDNSTLMLELARRLAETLPLANYALTRACSDEDRAFMRQLVGRDALFALSQALHRLSSTRAFNEGA